MITDPTQLADRTAKLASWAAVLTIVVGVVVLLGWTFDIEALKSVLPGWVAMKANTAVCFILIGVALWLTAHPYSAIRNPKSKIFLARFFSLLVGLIGSLSLGEYIFDWNPGIDQWLFIEPNGTVGTSYPGRMAPETALSFILLAAALWITGSLHQTRWTVLAAVNFGLLVTALALAAMLSYLTPGIGSYGWFGLTIMAMNTAILFVILGMTVTAMSWRQEVLPWLLGRNTTAAFGCGIVLLVLIGFNMNRSQFWLDEANRKIASSEEVLSNILIIQIELTEAQAHTRGYIITRDKGFLSAYWGDISEYHLKMAALRLRIAGNPDQQQQLSLIETNVDSLQRWSQQFIDAPQTGATRRKMDARGDEFLNSIHSIFAQIEDERRQLITELKRKSEDVARFSYITIATSTLVSLLIFLTVIFRFNSTINERMRAEESLRKLSQVVEQSPSSIVITDLDANIEYANPTFVRTTGYSLAELIGQNLRLLHSDKTPDATYKEMWAHLTRGESWKGEFINKRRDGSEFTESALVSPMRQPDGQVTHYMAIKKDITERKRMESELAEQLDELRRWHEVTSSREGRVLDLKHEVNELLDQTGKHPRYPSAESQNKSET